MSKNKPSKKKNHHEAVRKPDTFFDPDVVRDMFLRNVG
jgi:hypothetical protein